MTILNHFLIFSTPGCLTYLRHHDFRGPQTATWSSDPLPVELLMGGIQDTSNSKVIINRQLLRLMDEYSME